MAKKKDDASNGAGKGTSKGGGKNADAAPALDREAEAAQMRARLAELEREAEADRMRARLAELEREAEEAKAREAAEAADAERVRVAAEESEAERMRARVAELEREAEEAKARKAADAAAQAARSEAAAAARQDAEAEAMRARLANLEREAAAARGAEAPRAAAGPVATTGAVGQWQDPPPRKGRKGLTALVIVEAVALVAASALLVATLVGLPIPGLSTGTAPAAAALAAGPEVELVQASTVGSAPFNEIPFGPMPDASIALAATQENPAAGTRLLTTEVAGDTAFIYGWNADGGDAICNRDGLGDYYAGDAAAAGDFAEAINSDDAAAEAAGGTLAAAGVGDYVKSLFRGTLVADTLVTVVGRTDDGTENMVAVLQRGTAVLMDELGVPRVKCFGANPLLAAPEVEAAPTFVGTAWSGFLPNGVATIAPAAQATFLLSTLSPGAEGGTPFAIQSPALGDPIPVPASATCEPDGYNAATTAASMTITNSGDKPVLFYTQDHQSTNEPCSVFWQGNLAPGQTKTYPDAGQTFVPYPGIRLIATSSEDPTEIVWQSSVTQGQTSAEITY